MTNNGYLIHTTVAILLITLSLSILVVVGIYFVDPGTRPMIDSNGNTGVAFRIWTYLLTFLLGGMVSRV